MKDVATISPKADASFKEVGYVGRIPVRNLWLLMLYASSLFGSLTKLHRYLLRKIPMIYPIWWQKFYPSMSKSELSEI